MAAKGIEDGFQFVKTRRNKKNKASNQVYKTKPAISNDRSTEWIDQESMLRRIEECRQNIAVNDFMNEVKDILEHISSHVRRLNQAGLRVPIETPTSDLTTQKPKDSGYGRELSTNLTEVVCYGIGNFTSCPIARYQLALLIILIDELLVPGTNCYVYDPVFTQPEEEILKKLEFNVLRKNEEGKRRVSGPTVFYMPHCGRPLYNNLLWSNWQPNLLSHVIIIGNSFQDMAERTPDRIMRSESLYIHSILPYLTEYRLKNSFRFEDIFNDTAIQVFCPDKLATVENALWSHCPKPEYDQEDLEIITSSS